MATGKTLNAPFRLEHYRQLLRALMERGDVEFITYADLAWQDGDDHRAGYPLEWAAWHHKLKSGELNSKCTYVLLQHDIDSGPDQTLNLLRLENEYGVTSTTMIFNRWRGDTAGGELTQYPADIESMVELEKLGFVFGYHCNAFHNCGFKEEGIYEHFLEDVAVLRKKLQIKFFSPHGGQTLEGRGNASFDFLGTTGIDLKHVHNGCSPRFNSTFSDGGLIKRLMDGAENLDFLKWIGTLKTGCRYRMLIHPQYFSDEYFRPLSAASAPWYQALVAGDSVGAA